MGARDISLSAAKKIAFVGISAATVECAKLALAALPNVEVVTLLIAVYSYAFGSLGVLSSFVFVCIEPLIWGVNSWVITYFIYWPLLALVFMLLGKAKIKNGWLITAIAVLMTAFFGVLSSFVDIGLFSGRFDRFFYRFSIYYMRGISFYITQILTNAIVFPTLFPMLVKRLKKLSHRIS